MNGNAVGPMRHRVEIQERITSRGSYGEVVPEWATVATVWGEVLPLSGRELYQAQAVRPDVTHRVTVRYREGLSPRNRLFIDGDIYEIFAVLNPDGRKRYHTCDCIQRVT